MTPSPNRVRATRLFAGGLVGWHGGLALAAVVGLLLGGAVGLFSALIGAALAVFYYAIGQGVQMQYADASPQTIRTASIASYVVRVSLLGGLLYATIVWPGVIAAVDVRGLFAGIVLGVVGWLTGLVIAFRKLRVPTFDQADSGRYDPPGPGC
jgi:ATP synthase protein I